MPAIHAEQQTGEPEIQCGDAAQSNKVIVTVAFGSAHYLDRQSKFLRYAEQHAPHYTRMVFKTLPIGCPQHGSMEEGAYAFKIYAIDEAIKRGYRYIMWLDTSMMIIRPMQSLWDHIVKIGWYVCPQGGSLLGEYVSDEALAIYGIDRTLAMQIQLPYSGIVGLDMEDFGKDIFREWKLLCERGAFKGHHYAPHNPNRAAGGGKTIGHVSADKRVVGHRHDESALGFVLYKLGLTYWYTEGNRWYYHNHGFFAHETPTTGCICHINNMIV
jgi:hypothetical protein